MSTRVAASASDRIDIHQVPPHRHRHSRARVDPVLEKLRQYEPRSMGGQPPVVWDRAEGIQVYDRWGNMWLDWSSRRAGGQRRPLRTPRSARRSSTRSSTACCTTTVSPRRSAPGPSRPWPAVAPPGLEEGLPADHRGRGLRVRHQARAALGARSSAGRRRSPSSPSRTPSTAARSGRRWPAAFRP